MSLLRRTPVDPAVELARIEADRERTRAALETQQLRAQAQRDQQEAQAAFARRQAAADEQEQRRRADARRVERAAQRDRARAARVDFLAKARPVLPLLLINGFAAYAQAAYAYSEVAPETWVTPAKAAAAVGFAAAVESIAVYVQWHAHDALMLNAHATAAKLRRASWFIAAAVGGINYTHFADHMRPTAAAVAFALLSLLSPWLWGLHTRRAQHKQLLAEDANLIDVAGVEFSPQRRRAFPIRSVKAKRWSIDHYERDPRAAWEGYNAERKERQAAKMAAAPRRRPPRWLLLAGTVLTLAGAVTPEVVRWLFVYPGLLLNTLFVVLWLSGPRAARRPVLVREASAGSLTALVDVTAPTTAELVDQAVTRHLAAQPPALPASPLPAVAPSATTSRGRRWRQPTALKTRHLREAVSRRMSPGGGDTKGSPVSRRVSRDQPPADDSRTVKVSRRVSRPKPKPTTAERVAEAVAAAEAKGTPVKADALAKKFGVSVRTVQRHMPKQTVSTVNGHDHGGVTG